MRHVVIRGGADPSAMGALLETVRLALDRDDRIDIFTTTAVDAVVQAFARSWSALRVHPPSIGSRWREMVDVAHRVESGTTVFVDGDLSITRDDLLRLVDRANGVESAGLVAPLLLSADGHIVEAGRAVLPDGRLAPLGVGDNLDDVDYTCDRHSDACSMAIVALPRASIELLAQDPVSESDVADRLWRTNRPVIVSAVASAVVPHQSAAASVPDTNLRRMADRRHREGRQLLLCTSKVSHRRSGVMALAARLASSGSHVTVAVLRRESDAIAVDWRDSPAGRAGAMLALLDHSDDTPRGVRLQEVLARRHYDMALLWTPACGRWFLPRLHQYSPTTRVVARMPAGWRDTISRRLLEQVHRRWLSPEAFGRLVAPA